MCTPRPHHLLSNVFFSIWNGRSCWKLKVSQFRDTDQQSFMFLSQIWWTVGEGAAKILAPITTPVLLKLNHGSCWWNPNCVPWSGHLPIPMMCIHLSHCFKPYVGWWSPMANIYVSVGWSQQPVYLIVADTSRSFSWWKPQGHMLRASFSRFEVCQQGHCLIVIFFIEKYIAATWDIPWHDIPWYSHL